MNTKLSCVPATVKKANINLLQNLKPRKFGLASHIKTILYAPTI